jgi:hypothetical protein
VAARDLEMPVPFGTRVELSVSSNSYDLTGENNAAVDSTRGASVPVQVTPGDTPRVHEFTVTGRKAARQP